MAGELTDEPIDDYLPHNGNRGYRVSRYELDLVYKVASNRLAGRAVITAATTRARPRFSLDLAQSLTVTKLFVNGSKAAKYTHQRGKLTFAPAQQIPAGGALTIDVHYRGTPRPVHGPWGEVGWEELSDGVLVSGQPNGAASWFPCDDHPGAKASYRISVTADSPYYVVANGVLTHKRVKASQTTWVYEQPEPMSSYLATVQIGPYRNYRIHPAASGEPPMQAILPPKLLPRFEHDFARQPLMMAEFQRRFGPYPFEGYTVVVTDDELEIPLEAQGLSIFGANHCDGERGSERLIAHELAHQWFGNSLTVRRWRDIWLHEGFACYAEWIWSEAAGGPSADALARAAWQHLSRAPQDIVIGDPGPGAMFDDRVYKRGALTLHALRRYLGDPKFFTLLRNWTARHRHATVDTTEFAALAERFSETSFRPLWEQWLYKTALPDLPFPDA
ncbi:M1 family metallopeptidase [Nocardia terpenica]|uniref:Aminopeptidase N n=1 Tax=Nocardia terpenica TaxID=455432 RepID=A0A164P570_9NOCA|nr:M1 family metallopeptidase [Nocardia terpenica]KZM75133.1 peptidase M1 [Nocardia terpenica]NQE93740.1 M1 family metallopeptidase [Nocardia terpenica]